MAKLNPDGVAPQGEGEEAEIDASALVTTSKASASSPSPLPSKNGSGLHRSYSVFSKSPSMPLFFIFVPCLSSSTLLVSSIRMPATHCMQHTDEYGTHFKAKKHKTNINDEWQTTIDGWRVKFCHPMPLKCYKNATYALP
jgi:hypothetical protein